MLSLKPKYLLVAVLALCAALASGCGRRPPPQRPAPEVGVVVIKTQPVELSTVLPGRTDPFEVSDVRPQVSGLLLKRLFTEGTVVKEGQPLYQIDPGPYRAAYNNAVAALADAKAKADRYAMLAKQNAVAQQDYDDALAAYKEAAANVDTARINLGYTRITAPITGRIGRSMVTEGALVTADQTTALAEIDTLDPIYVDITQSASELLSLKLAVAHGRLKGDDPVEAPVRLELDSGENYPLNGKLEFSEVTVDQTTGAVTLRALFPNPDGILLPGMFVRATVIEGTQLQGILAPQQGVSRDEKGNATAYVVNAQGKAEFRQLSVSRAIGDKWLVISGLKPGDRLIVEGLQRVAPNAPVHAMPAGSGS
jgi:membrane fusion protein (multidrug efflux system)